MADLQQELNLGDDEFEQRLLNRLQQEISINQKQLELDLKSEVATEKKRILTAAVSILKQSIDFCLYIEPREKCAQNREH